MHITVMISDHQSKLSNHLLDVIHNKTSFFDMTKGTQTTRDSFIMASKKDSRQHNADDNKTKDMMWPQQIHLITNDKFNVVSSIATDKS